MPDATIVTVAKAVVTDLNVVGRFSLEFKAERKYQPKATLEELNHLNVQVAMSAWRVSMDNRTDWENQYDIDIGIMYRADERAGDQATDVFDKLMYLVEEIADYFQVNRPSAGDCPLINISFGVGGDEPYLMGLVEQTSLFVSKIKLTYWKLRDPSA